MKNKILMFSILFLVAVNFAYAHGDEHNHNQMKEHSEHAASDTKDIIVKGQLIGLTCFVKHASKGISHINCLKECAEKGLPIGILTKNNKIYQISGEGHGGLIATNKKFLKYAEQNVVVKGKVFSSNGMHMIVVKGIKKEN